MHHAAKIILHQFKGHFPSNREDLIQIKGLGPYTVGAILSFAFHKKTAAVDGNVKRALARYYLIDEDISNVRVEKKIWKLAEDLLHTKNLGLQMKLSLS